jgi:hypothetical protein
MGGDGNADGDDDDDDAAAAAAVVDDDDQHGGGGCSSDDYLLGATRIIFESLTAECRADVKVWRCA